MTHTLNPPTSEEILALRGSKRLTRMQIQTEAQNISPRDWALMCLRPSWTQSEAAGMAGVDVSTWKRWESGKHTMPRATFDRLRDRHDQELTVNCIAGVAVAGVADCGRFVVEAILDILPSKSDLVWRDESKWRVHFGDYFDIAQKYGDADGFDMLRKAFDVFTNPRDVVALGMTTLGDSFFWVLAGEENRPAGAQELTRIIRSVALAKVRARRESKRHPDDLEAAYWAWGSEGGSDPRQIDPPVGLSIMGIVSALEMNHSVAA